MSLFWNSYQCRLKRQLVYGCIDPFDLMEDDRKKVLDFMKGRAEVMVYNISENSGANTIYVSEILESEERRGTIRVIQRDSKGIPTIVTLS